MKKSLSVLLVVVLIFTAVPLGAFDFKVSAEGESQFDQYTYMADFLSNVYVDPLTGERDSIQNKRLAYYTDANNDIAHIMVNEINNSYLKESIAVWKIANFKPSDVTDQMLDEVGYYKAIIFNVINAALKSESLNYFSSSSVEKLGLELTSAVSKSLEVISEIEYEELCNGPISKINPGILTKLKDAVKAELTVHKLSSDFVGKVSNIIKYTNTFNDFVEDVANLSMVSRTTEDIKNVLLYLYNNCPDDQNALKTALGECYTVCLTEFDKNMTYILDGTLEVAAIGFGKMMDHFWESTISALSGGAGAWLLVAQTIGSSISNFAFSTEHIIEQGFAIECCAKFIDLAIKTVNDLETIYINNQSTENAQLYLRAIDIMFASEELGCDYASEYADIAYKEGLINNIQNLFGEDERYTEFKKNVSSIKNSAISTHTELLDIDWYACYIEVDYPELYEEYFKYLSYFTYETNGSEIEITGLQPQYLNTEKIVIPTKIHGQPVISIADFAFMQKDKLTKVVIPDSVKKIGKSAFAECFELNNISFGNGLESIDDYAFVGCEKLGALYLPQSLKSISHLAIPGCLNLTCVSVDSENQNYSSLNGVLFSKDGSRISIYPPGLDKDHYTVPNGVKIIEPYAFNLCSFKSLTLPATVTEIQSRAFYSTNLETIFYRGTKAEWLNLSKGFENDILFEVPVHFGTSKSHDIKEVVTKEPTCVGSGEKVCYCSCGFERTKELLPVGHVEGDLICEYCSLKNLRYSIENNEVVILGYYGEITNLIIPSKISGLPVTKIGSFAFKDFETLQSVSIPNSVTIIGEYAFYLCGSLKSITIPDSSISIGYLAFFGTGYYDNEANWEDDVLYIGKHLIRANTAISGSCNIKPGTLTIAEEAFAYCTKLERVNIPSGVTLLGLKAFICCYELTSVSIPNSVTNIGFAAFEDCRCLEEVSILDGVKTIGDYAFNQCYSLKDITISDSVTSIGKWAFSETAYYDNEENWIDNVLYINNHLIEAKVSILGNYSIKPGTLTIAPYAFSECHNLESIIMPDSVIYIAYEAFENCSNLKTAKIGNGVTSIGDSAFKNCYSLTSINLPNSVTNIGNSAFYCCNSATEVIIGKGIKNILNHTFSNCSSLTSVTLLDSVIDIYWTAFSYCENLSDVYYAGSEKDRENNSLGEYASSLKDATWHYNACIGSAEHTYDNKTDTICNICGVEKILYTPGDIDDNGAVSLTDIVTLAQYVAEWDVECNEEALDVNGDGDVTLTDVVHLSQYVAEWEGIELN